MTIDTQNKANKAKFELDCFSGQLAVLVEDFEALKTQVCWSADKLDHCFDGNGALDHKIISGYAHELHTDIKNITNLFHYLNQKLKELEEEMNEVVSAIDEA